MLNRCLCKLIQQDLVLNYVGPHGHLWQILVKVTIVPRSCPRVLFQMEHFLLCFLCCIIWKTGKLVSLVKKGSESVSVVVAILCCRALMPRATILFSLTKHAISSYIASTFSVPVWHSHQQLSCSTFAWPRSPESYSMPLLFNYSSSYTIMFISSIKLWKYCFSSSKFSNTVTFSTSPSICFVSYNDLFLSKSQSTLVIGITGYVLS